VEKTHCSSLEMYNCSRSCWITILVLPTHVLGEALIEASKVHNLFMEYSNNIYFGVMESS
jgi:hypothetical protein